MFFITLIEVRNFLWLTIIKKDLDLDSIVDICF